ncbi:MAG TPA: SRPBCC family protein [Aestuariivirgaceae bacterium]|nr:SRPBCC family protein [Aestuariivirgaceae bacterium]
MQKLRFSIVINAPKEKVWHAMLDDETYRQWSEAFAAGSHFVGSWEKGSRIVFLASRGNGYSGYVGRIAENRPYQFVSIEYLTEVQNGKEDTTGVPASWSGAHENYTFSERDGATEVSVELDTIAIDMSELRVLPAEDEMFQQIWPDALQRLKAIAEGTPPRNIIVSALVKMPIDKVWEYWIKPEHIMRWAFASDEWEALAAENDVRVGGKFRTVMAAKDKSARFDFAGTYTAVKEKKLIEFDMDDGRHAKVQFLPLPDSVQITTTFEPEDVNPPEMQQSGWQAILNSFKKYVEAPQ